MGNNQFSKNYAEYLRDESRVVGYADGICFPKTETEVIKTVKKFYIDNILMTVQGARTGLSAAAVPYGGQIVNLSKMNRIVGARYNVEQDEFYLTVQPGVLLIDIRKALANKSFNITDWDEISINALSKLRAGEWSFMPDPTETSASIGGMLGCNASGASSFKYGSTREHIYGIRVVLADGDILTINRGENISENGKFSIFTDSGKNITLHLPKVKESKVKKDTAGYYIKHDMDLIDLFIGCEGTLGIITQIELKLMRTFEFKWGITIFMNDEDKALDLVRVLRGEDIKKQIEGLNFKPSSIEFFNNNALKLLREEQKNNPAFAQIQELKENYHTAVYTEIESNNRDELWQTIKEIGCLIEKLGGNTEHTWVAQRSNDLAKLKFFRHAIPECVNMQIDKVRKTDPSLTKLGTDMSVLDASLKEVMKMYNEDLEKYKLNSVIFGHIGDNHLHVNIIPRNSSDYELGKKLYKKWAKKISEIGGSVSAEHAIGKLKIPFLKQMYTKEELNDLRKIKQKFDTKHLLNRGNIFEYTEEETKNENYCLH